MIVVSEFIYFDFLYPFVSHPLLSLPNPFLLIPPETLQQQLHWETSTRSGTKLRHTRSLLLQPSASLNNRFLPRPDHISTGAVLICDDNVEVDSKSLEFAVDAMRNFEDVLMNLVVAEEAQVGPLLVGAKRVRDYGDARNEGRKG
ncbi:glycosyltransferase family protein 64 C3-like [Vigna umbellata]|uniref:glycosyltransferase family protein 64 C3-like n=1 Tax=Vigna umbellata TaxID=87088 RepID=UPI001F5F5CA3|nr:glycosyltransferase family protein 64 C3-like [Vigna umbellata]